MSLSARVAAEEVVLRLLVAVVVEEGVVDEDEVGDVVHLQDMAVDMQGTPMDIGRIGDHISSRKRITLRLIEADGAEEEGNTDHRGNTILRTVELMEDRHTEISKF